MNLFLVPLNYRRGLIYALIALAESAWLTPVLASRITEQAGDLSAWFWSVLLLVALALLLGWLTDMYELPLQVSRGAGLGLAGFGVLLLLKVALFTGTPFLQLTWLGEFTSGLFSSPGYLITLLWILLGVGYIWWRCLYVGHTPPGPSIVGFTLQAGFIGYIVILILSNFTGASVSLLLLLTFVCCILPAMTLSYTQTIEEFHGPAATGSFNSRIYNALAVAGITLLLAIVLGTIFSFPVLDKIYGFIFAVLGFILAPLTALFFALLEWLSPWFERLSDWLGSGAEGVEPIVSTPQVQPTPALTEIDQTTSGPAWWSRIFVWLFWLGAASGIIYIFYRFTGNLNRRYKKVRLASGTIVNESVSPDGSGLKNIVSANLKKLGDLIGMVAQYGIGGDLKAAATIKRMYAAMTVLSKQHGFERAEYQTPLEFLDVLSTAWPALAEPFSLVTNAYINVHYGQLPEGSAGLNEVLTAWTAIYTAIEDEQLLPVTPETTAHPISQPTDSAP